MFPWDASVWQSGVFHWFGLVFNPGTMIPVFVVILCVRFPTLLWICGSLLQSISEEISKVICFTKYCRSWELFLLLFESRTYSCNPDAWSLSVQIRGGIATHPSTPPNDSRQDLERYASDLFMALRALRAIRSGAAPRKPMSPNFCFLLKFFDCELCTGQNTYWTIEDDMTSHAF